MEALLRLASAADAPVIAHHRRMSEETGLSQRLGFAATDELRSEGELA